MAEKVEPQQTGLQLKYQHQKRARVERRCKTTTSCEVLRYLRQEVDLSQGLEIEQSTADVQKINKTCFRHK